MDYMRALQIRVLSCEFALCNFTLVSCACGFLHDLACDFDNMQASLACINVHAPPLVLVATT